MILRQLGFHLNSYFIDNEIARNRITTVSREELDPQVLKNRVFDLISREIKEREAFIGLHELMKDGALGSVTVKDGAIYERFDFELPPKSHIGRNSEGYLVISNRLFDLTIIPKYEGFSTSVSHVLSPREGYPPLSPWLAIIKIVIRVKGWALIPIEEMEIYQWLDSFVSRMEEYISINTLVKRLNPDLIELLKSTK